MTDDLHILRIQCPDRKGLIAAITGVLYAHQLNIVEMKEFVEPVSNYFFLRLEISGWLDIPKIEEVLRRELEETALIQLQKRSPKNLVILVTKEHHCLSDLLIRQHFGELDANIKAVISNHDSLQEIAGKFGIPFICIPHMDKSREDFEEELMETTRLLHPDYLVLAKFMRILSPGFVAAYPNRMINIHHSFLPAFVGANPYRQAYERGVKLIGATAHFVTNELDEGPIITQKVIDAGHEYNVAGMVKAGHEVEKTVLAEALKLVLDERVFVVRNRTIIFD
jgi:formyltetrahydrofolate deformylase